jgi:DNA-binding response OmpR family regulator
VAEHAILVVDDEPKYVFIIKLNLEARGFRVIVGRDGEEAVKLAATEQLDLIILDIMMPGLNGFEACRQIRQFSPVPIIMLTAKAEESAKIEGLDVGADDYITKPFSIDELLARVRANLRRVELNEQSTPEADFQAGEFRIDRSQQRVSIGDREVSLTATEYRLLNELVNEAGRVLVPEYLLATVWGPGYEGDEAVLRQAMYRLRQKLEPNPKEPRYLLSKRGLGYMFVRPNRRRLT